ncbi:MAG: PKD domain-containing protein [Planctomycetales bacterium]|nr:PKD domain-containing protein [bacterium]UNM07363.1 MAG: PKD domain-containing protein [Planctomycetales bacterium]
MRRLTLLPLIACLLALAVQSCSGGSAGNPPVGNDGGNPPQAPATDDFLDALLLRDASGKLSGIQVSWDPVADNAAEAVTGYHIYQSSASIPDASRGDSALWLEDAGFLADGGGNNTIFPHSVPGGGAKLSYTKLADMDFTLNIGESWYYRISAVNESGDESALSPEVKVDVAMHSITDVTPATAGIGDQVVIEGLNFGTYDDTIDEVIIVGNQWNDTTHEFDQIDINATIIDWQPTEITFEVPANTTKGRVKVRIDGLTAQSFDLFENSDPYITAITPYERFLDQNLQIQGANFGTEQSGTNFVVANDQDQDAAANYSIYTFASITLKLKQGTAFGEVEIQVESNGVRSNSGYMFLKDRLPVASFSMNKTSGKVPVQINFNANGSSDVEGPIAKYTMDFGDGSPPAVKLQGEDATFSHIYSAAGSYDVVLVVEDGSGQEDSEQKTVNALAAAEVMLIEDIDNGQGVGNNYVPNVQALRDDVVALDLDYISGGYSVGIGQVAIDNGVKVVIWMRGGPGPGDPIQDWPRNWSEDEKTDLRTVLDAGIDLLLISQNHQYSGDDTSGNDWSALYGLTKQTDRIQEPGGSRPFTWMFGAPTDITYSDAADSIPSSPICLKGASFPGGVFLSTTAAEQYNGPGSSGNVPTAINIANNRIQMGLAVDTSLIGTDINANFIPGLVANDAHPFELCYSHGLTTAPDSNIGFSGGGYSHTNGTARLWVIGWSYSEISPTGASRLNILQNVLAWLDSSLTLP